jgi:hypothetical protein
MVELTWSSEQSGILYDLWDMEIRQPSCAALDALWMVFYACTGPDRMVACRLSRGKGGVAFFGTGLETLLFSAGGSQPRVSAQMGCANNS